MIDLVELRAHIAANAEKGIHVAPVVLELIDEVERLRELMQLLPLLDDDDFYIDSRGRIRFTDAARGRGYPPPLPLDPFEDTVPMLPMDGGHE